MQRFGQLDSLRGLAALVVLMCHAVGMCVTLTPLMTYTPLYLFVGAGHEAVIFFFILSGFVLSLPFYSGKNVSYITYLIRRIFRIYLPFAVAMSVVLVLCHVLFQGGVQNYGDWLSSKWNMDVTPSVVWQQMNLLSNHETTTYNPIVWSLITEMRVSIIFPLLMLFINRFHWSASLALALGCSILGGVNYTLHLESSLGSQTGFMDSIHFTALFIIGALVAKHRMLLIQKFSGLSRNNKILLLIMAFFAYTYSRGIKLVPIPFLDVVADWGIAIGVVIAIVFSLSEVRVARLLEMKPLAFAGKISYSLYLFHAIILFTMAHLLHQYMSSWVTVLLSIIPIFIISYAAWRWIEQPSIRLGKWATSRKNGNIQSKIEKVQQVS